MIFLLSALLLAPARAGVRSVYAPSLNPAAFSLAGALEEGALDFAWTPVTRPLPGAFGALWTATLRPPGNDAAPVWFRATFGAVGSGASFKLWVDDHFLIHAQSAAANASVVGYYPLVLNATGVLLRAEFAVIGADAIAQVAWGASADGPWAVVPAEALSPAVAAAEDAYQERRSAEDAGWNTWDFNDMLSSVLLPAGLALPLSFVDARARQTTRDVQMTCAPSLRPGLHAARGAYTEIERLDLVGGAASVRVETATTAAGDLVVLVTTLAASRAGDVTLSISPGVLFPYSDCAFAADAAALSATCAGAPTVTLRPCAPAAAVAGAASLSLPLPPAGASVALTTAPGGMSLAHAVAVVAGQRDELLTRFRAAGVLNETLAGLFTAVAWTTVYSDTQGIVNGEFGRSVRLFEWDTFLAGVLAARVDPWAASNNIVRLAKGATPAGFVPGFIQDEFGEVDNAKPQVGALALRVVFDAFGEAWLVQLVIDKLVRFNAWWSRARFVSGLVAPGSHLDPALAPVEMAGHDSLQAGKWETGLDNSPLYDNATFDNATGLLSQMDVGLHALYIADARALAALARLVGRDDLVADLDARAGAAAALLQSELWCEDAGTYLNKDYKTGRWVPWTAPPMLYPLIAGVPTMAQVERMLSRYYLNSSEWCGDVADCSFGLPSITRASPAFLDQNYWRGRIWGPMNWLVAQGLRMYASSPLVARAAASLAAQSRNTFLVEWTKNRHVMENYGALDGSGCSSASNADPFYHWGALTALVALEAAEQ
jgi:putative isomerase